MHYNKSVVSCQSFGRCRMEPVGDLSDAIKGLVCRIGIYDSYFGKNIQATIQD